MAGKLKPKTHLSPGTAIKEALKRHTVYGTFDTPHGHRIINDRGHPTVQKFVGSAITNADLKMRNRKGLVGDKTYMRDVVKQAKNDLARRIGSGHDPALRGQTHLMSTLLDHKMVSQFAAHLALSEELARKGLDSSVVRASPKVPGMNYKYMLLSSGRYLDITAGMSHKPSIITDACDVKELYSSRKFSKFPQPFDYGSLTLVSNKRKKARKSGIDQSKLRGIEEGPASKAISKREAQIKDIQERNAVGHVSTRELEKISELRKQIKALESERSHSDI